MLHLQVHFCWNKAKLKKNILNYGYRINFKCEGMLVHFFDRFYVVRKFILPSMNDLKFSPIGFDEKCNYLNDIVCNHNSKEYISNLKVYCKKIIPFVQFYKDQISSHNNTANNILTNQISLILPNFPKARQEKKGIIALLITGFIGSTYEGISSYLHNRRQKALQKEMVAMENKVNLQHNKIIHLEDLMVMYGIYNSETLEKLIDTVHKMHNTTTLNEKNYSQVHLILGILGI